MLNPLWRLLYRLYRIFSWVRYRMARRFTRPGMAVLGALAATALLAPDTENNAAYQALTLLLFLLLIAVAFSWFFRARFSAQRWLPRFGTVGSPFSYRIAIMNHSSKIQSGLTLLEDLADPRPSFREWHAAQLANQNQIRVSQHRRTNPFKLAAVKLAPVPSALPNQEVEVCAELTPLRRGTLRFTGVTLALSDPLGLYRGCATIPLPQTALVLPRRYALPPMALPGLMKHQERGVALASSVGQSDQFIGLRDYRHGDPMRHIHWRSWAKAGKPVVKEYEDEFFVRHALVLDTFIQGPGSEVFEEAVSVAASFACAVRTQESLLDLLFVGTQSYCITAGRGLGRSDQLLEVLASVKASDEPFSTLERLVLNHLRVVSGCICVLTAWDQERRAFVEKIKMLGVPVLVFVILPSGQNTTPDPGPMRDEPERFHVLEAGKIEQGLSGMK